MTKAILTAVPTSSLKTPRTAGRNRGGDGALFPDCRKDANCHCEMCLASIHATRDLLPSLTKISRRNIKGRNLTDLDTPPGSPDPPRTKSKPVGRIRCWIPGRWFLGFLCLLWVADSGGFALMLRGFRPKLTPDVIEFDSGAGGEDFRASLEALQRKIKGVVGEGVSDCSCRDTNWELIQGNNIFIHWRCVLYQSIAEEMSVWGSPIETSGLLHTGFSARSLTLLSGFILEWSEGGIESISRSSNSSWTIDKWSSTVVQLEANTWVLEYTRSALFEAPGLIPATWEVLRMRAIWTVKKLKHEPWSFWLARNRESKHRKLEEMRFEHPT